MKKVSLFWALFVSVLLYASPNEELNLKFKDQKDTPKIQNSHNQKANCQILNLPDAFRAPPTDFALFDEKLFKCDGSMLNLPQIKALVKAAQVVRGQSVGCMGQSAYERDFNAFGWILLRASFDVSGYGRTLQPPEVAEGRKDAQTRYFRYWAHASIHNFMAHKQFWRAYNDSLTPLVKFYEHAGIDAGSAAYYATSVLGEFLTFAVGSPEKLGTLAHVDITATQKLLADKSSDASAVTDMLYSREFSQRELTKLLNTALLHERDTQILNAIIKRGARLDLGDETPLFFALTNVENVKFLLRNGADVNAKNAFGKTPLFYAVQFKDAKSVRVLLAAGANVNARYIDANTKNALINFGGDGSDICALEHTSRSVFMHAAAHAGAEILQILSEAGADRYAVDDFGFNAVDYAIANTNKEAMKFLENLGLRSNFNEGE